LTANVVCCRGPWDTPETRKKRKPKKGGGKRGGNEATCKFGFLNLTTYRLPLGSRALCYSIGWVAIVNEVPKRRGRGGKEKREKGKETRGGPARLPSLTIGCETSSIRRPIGSGAVGGRGGGCGGGIFPPFSSVCPFPLLLLFGEGAQRGGKEKGKKKKREKKGGKKEGKKRWIQAPPPRKIHQSASLLCVCLLLSYLRKKGGRRGGTVRFRPIMADSLQCVSRIIRRQHPYPSWESTCPNEHQKRKGKKKRGKGGEGGGKIDKKARFTILCWFTWSHALSGRCLLGGKGKEGGGSCHMLQAKKP